MEQDKVKVVKYRNGYEIYINDTKMKLVKDFKIDEFGVNSEVTIKLACVDLKIIDGYDEIEKQDCTVKVSPSVLAETIREYLEEGE